MKVLLLSNVIHVMVLIQIYFFHSLDRKEEKVDFGLEMGELLKIKTLLSHTFTF